VTDLLVHSSRGRTTVADIAKVIPEDFPNKQCMYIVFKSLLGLHSKNVAKTVRKNWELLSELIQQMQMTTADVLWAFNRYFEGDPNPPNGFLKALEQLTLLFSSESIAQYYSDDQNKHEPGFQVAKSVFNSATPSETTGMELTDTNKQSMYIELKSLLGMHCKKISKVVDKNWEKLSDLFQHKEMNVADVLWAFNRYFDENPNDPIGFPKALEKLPLLFEPHESDMQQAIERTILQYYRDAKNRHEPGFQLAKIAAKPFLQKVVCSSLSPSDATSMMLWLVRGGLFLPFLAAKSMLRFIEVRPLLTDEPNLQKIFGDRRHGTVVNIIMNNDKDSVQYGSVHYGFIKSDSMTEKSFFTHVTDWNQPLRAGMKVQYDLKPKWIQGTKKGCFDGFKATNVSEMSN